VLKHLANLWTCLCKARKRVSIIHTIQYTSTISSIFRYVGVNAQKGGICKQHTKRRTDADAKTEIHKARYMNLYVQTAYKVEFGLGGGARHPACAQVLSLRHARQPRAQILLDRGSGGGGASGRCTSGSGRGRFASGSGRGGRGGGSAGDRLGHGRPPLRRLKNRQ
jgi:hypothetical protein